MDEGVADQQRKAMETDPDVALMLRVKAGHEQAFKELFGKYKRRIVSFARRYMGSQERAEDAAQEVFLRLYRARADYSPDAKFSTYLYRIATNTCLNHLRKRDFLVKEDPESEGESVTDRIADASHAGPDDSLLGKQVQGLIATALKELPENQRAALILLRFEDLSYEEIAAVLQTTVPAVKSLLNRAKEHLLKRLEGQLGQFAVPYQKGKSDAL